MMQIGNRNFRHVIGHQEILPGLGDGCSVVLERAIHKFRPPAVVVIGVAEQELADLSQIADACGPVRLIPCGIQSWKKEAGKNGDDCNTSNSIKEK